MSFNAGAEAVQRSEGNTSGAVMRGTTALSGSKTSSRTNVNAQKLVAIRLGRVRLGGG